MKYDIVNRIGQSDRIFRLLQKVGLPLAELSGTIVVAGSPRSGTTWLAEMMAKSFGYTLLDEPLHLRWPAVRRAGIHEWRPYVPPEAQAPDIRAYMGHALRGQVACSRQFQAASQVAQVGELLSSRHHVVKFVRANRLLPWLTRQFAVRGSVLILRHPCAVVASQLHYSKNAGWRRTKPPTRDELQSGFNGWIPADVVHKFEAVLETIETTPQKLAAIWCLDTHFPLCEEGTFPGIITTYEGLLTRQEQEVTRIFHALGSEVPAQTLQSFDEHSYSASEDLKTKDVEAQLGKWRDKLEPSQIEDVLRIVDGFGLDFYSEKLEPDYNRIYRSTDTR